DARLAGGCDRLRHAGQGRRDGAGGIGQQLPGPPAQRASRAAPLLIELVFGAAAGAGAEDPDPGAIGASVRARAGRSDQPAPLPAAAAHRDGRGLPARCAFAVAARVIPATADLANRPAVLVEPGCRLDLAAGGAGPCHLPGTAPLAHPAAVTAEQRLAGPPAD